MYAIFFSYVGSGHKHVPADPKGQEVPFLLKV